MNSADPILLDINSLLAGEWSQLSSLLTHSYPHPDNANKTAIDKARLVNLLSQHNTFTNITRHILGQLNATESLDNESYALLKFIDQLFDNFAKNCKLHPTINEALNPLRALAAIHFNGQQLPWLIEPGLIAALDIIYPNAIGWQPELGRAADRFLNQFNTHIEVISNEPEKLNDNLKKLSAFFNGEHQRINKLEKRLRDSELGALHAKHAHQLSAKTLNQHMAGKKLPAAISQFLQGPWRESMKLIIINQGKDSKDWQRIVRLTETLIWTFQPMEDNSAEFRQHVYHSISELSDQLQEVTIGLHHSSNLEQELGQVEQQHLNILKGKSLDYDPFQLIDNTDPLVSSQVSVSNSLINLASSFDEGKWFILNNEQGEQRIKLTAKIPQAQQLLFSNFFGIKAGQYSFEEFAYMLSSKLISPVKTRNPFKATGEKIVSTLLQRYQQQQQQAASDQAIEQEIVRQQEIARQAARDKALKEAKAYAEAQQAARLKAAKEEQELKQRLSVEQHEKATLQQLASLVVGGIVIFYVDSSKGEHCKLAAVIQSSGEHIFVNREGIKKYSLTKEELSTLLINEKAKIIDPGSSFENTLEQVVNNLRTRK